jgi:hypothetical protein
VESSVNTTRHSSGLTERWISKIALAIVLAVASPLAAAADTILATSPSGLPWIQEAEGVLGYKFDVLDEDFLVTRLGFFDSFGNGLARSHDIGLWSESGGAPLASATIPAGTGATLEAEFRWVDLTTPLLLSANTSYFLAATFAMNDFVDIARGDAVIDPLFSVVNAGYYADGSGLIFPANHFPGVQGFFGPNLAGNAVPDRNSSILLMGLSVLFLALWARLQT